MLTAAAQGESSLRLATTTSVENSGLLAFLLPDFERQCDCKVRAIIAGSGKALAFGRQGDVDVVLTHAPADEKQFVVDGFGILRRAVMHNNFILVGPPKDPANAASQPNIAAAMRQISSSSSRFISRDDDSGTHKKERALWKTIKQQPGGEWYLQAGGGMGQTLLMANELRAYTLSDRGTYLALRDKIALAIIRQNGAPNPYSVMAINHKRHPHVRATLARQFIFWLTSPAVQKKISEYRYYGESLFIPAHIN